MELPTVQSGLIAKVLAAHANKVHLRLTKDEFEELLVLYRSSTTELNPRRALTTIDANAATKVAFDALFAQMEEVNKKAVEHGEVLQECDCWHASYDPNVICGTYRLLAKKITDDYLTWVRKFAMGPEIGKATRKFYLEVAKYQPDFNDYVYFCKIVDAEARDIGWTERHLVGFLVRLRMDEYFSNPDKQIVITSELEVAARAYLKSFHFTRLPDWLKGITNPDEYLAAIKKRLTSTNDGLDAEKFKLMQIFATCDA